MNYIIVSLNLSDVGVPIWGGYHCQNVNVNVYVYSLISVEFSRLHYSNPWYWNSFLYSLISSKENSAFAHFAAAIASHYKLAFSFHQVPISSSYQNALPSEASYNMSQTQNWQLVNVAWLCILFNVPSTKFNHVVFAFRHACLAWLVCCGRQQTSKCQPTRSLLYHNNWRTCSFP